MIGASCPSPELCCRDQVSSVLRSHGQLAPASRPCQKYTLPVAMGDRLLACLPQLTIREADKGEPCLDEIEKLHGYLLARQTLCGLGLEGHLRYALDTQSPDLVGKLFTEPDAVLGVFVQASYPRSFAGDPVGLHHLTSGIVETKDGIGKDGRDPKSGILPVKNDFERRRLDRKRVLRNCFCLPVQQCDFVA